jgi:hypothetical protein
VQHPHHLLQVLHLVGKMPNNNLEPAHLYR